MSITEESRRAYYSIERLASPRNRQVHRFIELNPGVSNEDIAIGMKLPIQSITPRTREQKANGTIIVTGRVRTRSGRFAVQHSVVSCPVCMGTSLDISPRNEITFDYMCRGCGCRFEIYVGESQSDIAELRILEGQP